MPSIFTLRSSTLRSGADFRADILALTQTPATVTLTPVALGVSAAISLALSPATITVTGIADGITPGTASPALSPATVTVTAVAAASSPGAITAALSPATVTVTPAASTMTAAISLAQSPATITTTGIAQGISAAVTPVLAPATITTTPVGLGVTPTVSLAQSPATITVTPLAAGLTVVGGSLPSDPCIIQDEAGNPITDEAGKNLLLESCAETTATPPTGAGGGKWDVTRASRDAWRKQLEGESMLVREDEELLLCLL